MQSGVEYIQRLLCDYNDSFQQVRLSQIKNTSGYDTVVISSDMSAYRPRVDRVLFARINDTEKNPFISFKTKYKYWFDERAIDTYTVKSDIGFFRIRLSNFWAAVNQYEQEFAKFAATICLDSMSFPKFGCCSRFRECSACGKCIHADLLYASACDYRRNLESGRVFYK